MVTPTHWQVVGVVDILASLSHQVFYKWTSGDIPDSDLSPSASTGRQSREETYASYHNTFLASSSMEIWANSSYMQDHLSS